MPRPTTRAPPEAPLPTAQPDRDRPPAALRCVWLRLRSSPAPRCGGRSPPHARRASRKSPRCRACAANQLIGYGLVVGLDGTGDQTTRRAVHRAEPDRDAAADGRDRAAGHAACSCKNVAAVMVTAQLPAFAQPGQAIDVNVSSIGNAKSLRGGTLITTPLKGADGADLRAGAGQPDRRRRRRVGRRLQGADQPPVRRPRARTAPPSSAPCRRR